MPKTRFQRTFKGLFCVLWKKKCWGPLESPPLSVNQSKMFRKSQVNKDLRALRYNCRPNRLIYTLFGRCCYQTEKFPANILFDLKQRQRADSRRQQHSYFTNTLVLNILKLVLYYDWTVTNNQIRCSITANRWESSADAVWFLRWRLDLCRVNEKRNQEN